MWKIDIGICDKRFIWNLSNCECECDKSCDIGEYENYENWKYKKKLVDKLVEECTKNVEEVKLPKITLAEDENKHKNKCSFVHCTLFYFNNFYNKLCNWYLFWLVQIKKLFLDIIMSIKQQIININGKYQTN